MFRWIIFGLLCWFLWAITDDSGFKVVVRGIASEIADGASDLKTGSTKWLVEHTPKKD